MLAKIMAPVMAKFMRSLTALFKRPAIDKMTEQKATVQSTSDETPDVIMDVTSASNATSSIKASLVNELTLQMEPMSSREKQAYYESLTFCGLMPEQTSTFDFEDFQSNNPRIRRRHPIHGTQDKEIDVPDSTIDNSEKNGKQSMISLTCSSILTQQGINPDTQFEAEVDQVNTILLRFDNYLRTGDYGD